METFIAAVDLGGTAIKGALFTDKGSLVIKHSSSTESERGYTHVLKNIDALINQLCAQAGCDIKQVAKVGLGVPAFTSNAGKRVVLAPNLGWRDVCCAADLSRIVGLPVFCNNDANLAALGEYWQGMGRGTENMLMITIGTGIGSGLILAGELYQGTSGMAVEIGHMVIMAEDGPQCGCGRRGCVETLTSAPAVLSQAKKALRLPRGEWPAMTVTDVKQVYQAAADGDPRAAEIVERAAYYLGTALANILNFYELDRIVIGGGVSQAGGILLNPLRRVVERETIFYQRRPTEIVLGKLGNDAGIYGAARWALLHQ